MAMTHRQELLAAARKERLGKLPFGARVDLWYNYNSAHDTLPAKYRGWSMMNIMRALGIAAQYRYFSVVKEEFHDMEVIQKEEPPYVKTEFRTPLGSVQKSVLLTPSEGPWIGYEHEKLFKTEADYPIIRYVMEHTTPVPDPGYAKVSQEVGEDGLVMTGIGSWSAPQRVMREIMGYERFFYELMDRPEKVEELLETVKELDNKKYEVALTSNLELYQVCSNWSDDIHTPVFKKYFLPLLQETVELLHAHGKLAMAHIDGENRRLLPFLPDTHIDVWEAWTPAPMTQVTNAELRKALGDEAVIWGGVPATLFEPTYSDEEFDNYVINNLFKEIAPGYNFIVGLGDNLPFDGKIERVCRIAELIERYGTLPIAM